LETSEHTAVLLIASMTQIKFRMNTSNYIVLYCQQSETNLTATI